MEERREKKRLLTVAKKTSLQILPSTKHNCAHLTFINLCLQTIKTFFVFDFYPSAICMRPQVWHFVFFLTVFSATYVMSRFHVFLLFADCIFFRHGRTIHFSPACCTNCYLSLCLMPFACLVWVLRLLRENPPTFKPWNYHRILILISLQFFPKVQRWSQCGAGFKWAKICSWSV